MKALNGFINVLKPTGMTSSDVVVTIRRMLPKGTNVGHGGTLDPDAAGVLPICIGRATRLFDYMIDKQKTYIAELTLGIETDTQDQTGRVVRKCDVNATQSDVEAVLPTFVGDIEQIPPMYSAIKKDGKRLYELARKGETVVVQPRKVHVDQLQCLGQIDENKYRISVECRKGVYVRTLMHDIGNTLGCGGHMSFLMRSKAGSFDQRDAHTIEEILQYGERGALEDILLPMDFPVTHLERLDVPNRLKKAAVNGARLDVHCFERQPEIDTPVRVYLNNQFWGIAKSDGEQLRFACVLGDHQTMQTGRE